jgi:hypothetical protein
MNWNHWSLDRVIVLFVAFAYLFIGVQVTLSHYRQNFHHKSMWGPVLSSPVFFLTGAIASIWNIRFLALLFILFMWIGMLEGFAGFYYHFRGVGIRVGGWTFRNFLIGPPVLLPLLFSSLSILALIAVYWR